MESDEQYKERIVSFISDYLSDQELTVFLEGFYTHNKLPIGVEKVSSPSVVMMNCCQWNKTSDPHLMYILYHLGGLDWESRLEKYSIQNLDTWDDREC